jgi:transcription antitermination factor NusG
LIDRIAANPEQAVIDGMHRWFALRVKSRYEKLVSTLLRDKGYEEFLPLYWSRRRWSDRFQSVELPLFPGYVFCRLDPRYRLPLLITPGVLHFVGIGRNPEPIEDGEVAAVQSAVGSGLRAEPWPFLRVGHRVRLGEGPLSGLEGILIEVRKQHRIVVSVTLLQRSVAVEIERQWVRPLDTNQPGIDISRPSPLAVGTICT